MANQQAKTATNPTTPATEDQMLERMRLCYSKIERSARTSQALTDMLANSGTQLSEADKTIIIDAVECCNELVGWVGFYVAVTAEVSQ